MRAIGITVNAICPGYIGTEMVRAIDEKVLDERILPQIPVGRLGEPEEVARCVVFLASDDAGFITGSTLIGQWRTIPRVKRQRRSGRGPSRRRSPNSRASRCAGAPRTGSASAPASRPSPTSSWSRRRIRSSCCRAGPGDGHGEAAAAKMRREILRPQCPPQLCAELGQRSVAGGVAGQRVELVQPVELERHEGGVSARRPQIVEKGALIVEPGQGIEQQRRRAVQRRRAQPTAQAANAKGQRQALAREQRRYRQLQQVDLRRQLGRAGDPACAASSIGAQPPARSTASSAAAICFGRVTSSRSTAPRCSMAASDAGASQVDQLGRRKGGSHLDLDRVGFPEQRDHGTRGRGQRVGRRRSLAFAR